MAFPANAKLVSDKYRRYLDNTRDRETDYDTDASYGTSTTDSGSSSSESDTCNCNCKKIKKSISRKDRVPAEDYCIAEVPVRSKTKKRRSYVRQVAVRCDGRGRYRSKTARSRSEFK